MKKLCFAFALIISVSGCSNTMSRNFADENPKNVLFINWNNNIAKTFIDGTYQTQYSELIKAKKMDEAKDERNKQLDNFILGVDSYYNKNKNALITGTGIENTVADIIQLGLTGAASFAGGGTPNLLAGIATAINGSKLSFDKNVLADNSSLLLASKMDQLRLSKINDITQKKLWDCTLYPLETAMKDAVDYYYAGTVNGALLGIFTDTSNKMKEEEKVSKDLIDNSEPNLILRNKILELKEKELNIKERMNAIK